MKRPTGLQHEYNDGSKTYVRRRLQIVSQIKLVGFNPVANTRCRLLFVHRLQRWPNIKPTLGQFFMFIVKWVDDRDSSASHNYAQIRGK